MGNSNIELFFVTTEKLPIVKLIATTNSVENAIRELIGALIPILDFATKYFATSPIPFSPSDLKFGNNGEKKQKASITLIFPDLEEKEDFCETIYDIFAP